MEWKRLKTIIIIMLLLVNGFLMVVVGTRLGEVRRYEQAALDQAVRVLGSSGIEVNTAAIREVSGPSALTVERSIPQEREMAAVLLGAGVSGQNQSGGLYTYRSDSGTVSFRSGGQVYARLEDEARWHTDHPETLALGLVKELKLDCRMAGSWMENGSGRVVLRQFREDVPLFSCQLVFVFEEGRLISISGVLASEELRGEEREDVLTLPTAMLRFMEGVLNSGDVCSRVESMEPGYRMTQSFSNVLRLESVWLITTNAADYYVNAVTGEVTRLTGE